MSGITPARLYQYIYSRSIQWSVCRSGSCSWGKCRRVTEVDSGAVSPVQAQGPGHPPVHCALCVPLRCREAAASVHRTG